MTFGDILRQLLSDHDLTQKQLAANLNIAASTLGNYIQNSREPDFETLKKLAHYFGVSVDYLLDNSTRSTITHAEEELLQLFRRLTPIQQEIYLEQGKVIAKFNRKNNIK